MIKPLVSSHKALYFLFYVSFFSMSLMKISGKFISLKDSETYFRRSTFFVLSRQFILLKMGVTFQTRNMNLPLRTENPKLAERSLLRSSSPLKSSTSSSDIRRPSLVKSASASTQASQKSFKNRQQGCSNAKFLSGLNKNRFFPKLAYYIIQFYYRNCICCNSYSFRPERPQFLQAHKLDPFVTQRIPIIGPGQPSTSTTKKTWRRETCCDQQGTCWPSQCCSCQTSRTNMATSPEAGSGPATGTGVGKGGRGPITAAVDEKIQEEKAFVVIPIPGKVFPTTFEKSLAAKRSWKVGRFE